MLLNGRLGALSFMRTTKPHLRIFGFVVGVIIVNNRPVCSGFLEVTDASSDILQCEELRSETSCLLFWICWISFMR